VVVLGGLARTDQAGYGEEFRRVAAGLLAELAPDDVAKQDAIAGRDT
jgi:cytochrome c biogenesis protein